MLSGRKNICLHAKQRHYKILPSIQEQMSNLDHNLLETGIKLDSFLGSHNHECKKHNPNIPFLFSSLILSFIPSFPHNIFNLCFPFHSFFIPPSTFLFFLFSMKTQELLSTLNRFLFFISLFRCLSFLPLSSFHTNMLPANMLRGFVHLYHS